MSSSFGYEASREIIADDDLPVDIHHRKFAQWLVDRRKAPKDWHDKLRAILLKVDALARNLPATLTRCTGECVPDPHILAPSDGVEPVRWDYYRARLVRDTLPSRLFEAPVHITAAPGDLFLFNSEFLHDTPVIRGRSPRTVFNAFAGFSSMGDELELYA